MKKTKNAQLRIFVVAILCLSFAFSLTGCGNSTSNNSSSANTSSEIEYEFTASDLTGIFELPTIYVAENATNVVLSGVLDYDDTIIKSITGGEVDATKLGMQDVTLTITVDKAALAEAIGLDGDFSGEAEIEYTVSVNVILEDVIEDTLLTMVDSIILGSDNTVYELTEEADTTDAATETETSSADTTTEQSESGTTEAATTTTSTPKVTTAGSSKVTTSSGKVSSTTSAANNKSNTATTTTNSNKGNTSSNTGSGTTSSNKSNTTSTTKTDTKKDTTTSTSTSTKTDTSTSKTDTSKKTETTTTTTTPTHTHSWKAVYKTVHHDEVGHNETKTVTAAYDEPIYETRYVCEACGKSFSDDENFVVHIEFDHADDGTSGRYYVDDVQVGTKHHDAVTETVYVVDTAAYDEQVIDHYECSCGATK
jgi:hypothetical protein